MDLATRTKINFFKSAIFRAWARSNVDSGAELNLMRIKKALKDFGLK